MRSGSKQKWVHDATLHRLASSASPSEVLEAMRTIARQAQLTPFVQIVASGVNSFENVPAALFKCVKFLPDTNGEQIMQFPNRLYRMREGNCVDYTIFICSIAAAMGLPTTIRMVNYGGGFEHVYPVVNGQVYDLNYWQAYRPGEKKSLPFVEKMEKSV